MAHALWPDVVADEDRPDLPGGSDTVVRPRPYQVAVAARAFFEQRWIVSRIETFTWHPMTRYRPGASIIFRSTGVV